MVKTSSENSKNTGFVKTKSPKTELLREISSLKAEFEGLKKKAASKTGGENLQGSLRIANGAHGPQFFHITLKGDTKGRYLSVKNTKDMELARKLAQKDYFEKVRALAEDWLSALEKVERSIMKLPSETSVFPQQPVRRSLVNPLDSEMTDDEFVREWQSVKYKGKSIDENSVCIKTNRGEMVRSKSECLIANKLDSMGIPYRYEYPVTLKVNTTMPVETEDGEIVKIQKEHKITAYPDFTILGPNRREIIIEHFGMMDDPEYSEKAVRKMSFYNMNGYFAGDNLLVTYETKSVPFDIQGFEKMVLNLFSK